MGRWNNDCVYNVAMDKRYSGVTTFDLLPSRRSPEEDALSRSFRRSACCIVWRRRLKAQRRCRGEKLDGRNNSLARFKDTCQPRHVQWPRHNSRSSIVYGHWNERLQSCILNLENKTHWCYTALPARFHFAVSRSLSTSYVGNPSSYFEPSS